MTEKLITPYQSQYYDHLLTRRAAGNSVEALASTLVDSQVDLNPHHVEQLEGQLQQQVQEQTLITIGWELR